VRDIALLFVCEALSRTASVVVLASMALAGQGLSPHPSLGTLPLALVPVSTMLTTMPAARFMQRRGRKPGFVLGALLGVAGGLVCALGMFQQRFALLCLGAAGIGAVNGFATYYRFAAAEAAQEHFRSRAISLVMAGGVVAAFSGANLATWSRDWLGGHAFAGTFLCIALVHALVPLVLLLASLPRPQVSQGDGEGRPLREIARQPDFVLAVLGAVFSWAVMSLLMNATPLSMKRHMHSFGDTAWVIQWHVLGMYVPSFFTGHLIRFFGEYQIMAAGLLLLLCSTLVNLGGMELGYYLVGLTLLGVGWNFLFVGATALLTSTYRPEEQARVQSLNDFLIFAAMVLTTFGSAPLEEALGWQALNRLAVPLVLLVLLGMTLLRVRARLYPSA
jgi:MFS family permease